MLALASLDYQRACSTISTCWLANKAKLQCIHEFMQYMQLPIIPIYPISKKYCCLPLRFTAGWPQKLYMVFPAVLRYEASSGSPWICSGLCFNDNSLSILEPCSTFFLHKDFCSQKHLNGAHFIQICVICSRASTAVLDSPP